MSGYKVRIGDGSEIGPLDLAAVRTWFSQGLIDGDSPVLRPGTRNWTTLREVPELSGLVSQSPAKPKGKKKKKAKAAEEDGVYAGDTYSVSSSLFDDPDKLRIRIAGVLFLVAALGMGYFALRPENAVPDLDGAPWTEIALGLLVCALALLPGWDLGRRLVRVLAGL